MAFMKTAGYGIGESFLSCLLPARVPFSWEILTGDSRADVASVRMRVKEAEGRGRA